MLDLIIGSLIVFIHIGFNDIFPKILGIQHKEINYVKERLNELKNKPNKTVQEQLEYIELKRSGMQKFNFSATNLIKLMLFILLYQIFKNKLLLIGLGLIYILIKNLVKTKKYFFGKLLFDIENYLFVFIFLKLVLLFGLLKVFLLIFACSFIYNLTLKCMEVKKC
ncbi:MAG: hypothetical protein ACTSW3_08085 [Promethearchaeota archaeon]